MYFKNKGKKYHYIFEFDRNLAKNIETLLNLGKYSKIWVRLAGYLIHTISDIQVYHFSKGFGLFTLNFSTHAKILQISSVRSFSSPEQIQDLWRAGIKEKSVPLVGS